MGNQNNYHIIKTLNNNVVIATRLRDQQEMILIGKGIGFKHKAKDIVYLPHQRIEKVYCNFETKFLKDYLQLMSTMDHKVAGIVEEFIHMAEEELGQLDVHIHIALTDHIGFAMERLKQGLVIHNPFLYEIKAMYPNEYALGMKGRKLLYQQLGVEIPEDEVGFIALHLHSSMEKKDIKYTLQDTRLLQDLLSIIEAEMKCSKVEGLNKYSRLISHLKQSIRRAENRKQIKNPLLNEIKIKCASSYGVAHRVAEEIEKRRAIQLTEDELGYLALHIERLKN